MDKMVYLLCMTTLAVLLLKGCTPMNESQKKRDRRIKSSPQYDGSKFVNPDNIKLTFFSRNNWEMLKKYIFLTRVDAVPKDTLPVHPLKKADLEKQNKGEFHFSWLGHSSLLIWAEGQLILVDPVLKERASPLSWIGPKRFHPPPMTAAEFPAIDVVLITHDHYDHLEKPTILALADKAGIFIVPLGIGELLEDWGVPTAKIIELDWWEAHRIGSLSFHATPAVHYSSRGLFDMNKRLWCSWSVKGKNKSFFISGDSGYFDGFKKAGKKLGPFDITFLKIGAYDETWKIVHMTPEGAAKQHLDLKGKLLVPLHWATFDLGLHPWHEPIERIVIGANKNKFKILTPEIGQKINIKNPPKFNTWWRRVK